MRGLPIILVGGLLLFGCDKKDVGPVSSPDAGPSAVTTVDEQPPSFEPPTKSSKLPGRPLWTTQESSALAAALDGLEQEDYRTRHVSNGNPIYTNLLLLEDSPYLRQHAHNPVNWRPWSEEAFAIARQQNKPVLLSVGYATCHWCHVMERESFEDVEVAEFLNRHYIPIKVDREERPDIDAVYMAAVRELSGRGGWPMTVWLTPEADPFFGGTYFPARAGDRPGMPGFLELLKEQADSWASDPQGAAARGEKLAASVRQTMELQQVERVRPVGEAMHSAVLTYEQSFDERHGGWGRQKFPMVPRLRFLLRYGRRAPESAAHDMVRTSLDAMARGGLRDHVGGGFHRYTVDPEWGVPHFEKMLYDNALLALLYLEAGLALDEPRYVAIARETLDFAASELRTEAGAYYSALDAESGGAEGGYYTWTPQELERVGASETFRLRMGSGLVAGEGALNLRDGASLSAALRTAMSQARKERDRPRTDEKVVAEWNGMMLQALVAVGFATNDAELLHRGREIAVFLRDELWEDGHLARSWTPAGGIGSPGTASDYAFVISGLIALFEATGEREWLELALAMQKTFDANFFDAERGAYRRVAIGREILAPDIPVVDDATPSANAQALLNLQKLAALTLSDRYAFRAKKMAQSLSGPMSASPAAVPHLLLALDFSTDRPREVVVATASEDDSPLVEVVRTTFAPSKVFVVGAPDDLGSMTDVVPWLKGKGLTASGEERAFVCYETVCELPTSDPSTLERQISAREPI